MNQDAFTNLVTQIHTNWVKPEVERRNYKEPIFAILVIFKSDKTEVLLNNETHLMIEIDPNVGGHLTPGADVTIEEFAKHKIKSIKVPAEIFDSNPFIAAVTLNGHWTVYFNTIPDKAAAKVKLQLAEDFIKAASSAATDKVRAYNVFQALEQAMHAALLTNPNTNGKVKESRKHSRTKELLNLEAKKGNIPANLAKLFNRLHENRPKLYTDESMDCNISDIQAIEEFIESQRKNLVQ